LTAMHITDWLKALGTSQCRGWQGMVGIGIEAWERFLNCQK